MTEEMLNPFFQLCLKNIIIARLCLRQSNLFSENDLGIEAEEMYKLSDSLGRTTVLRPDNTAPIARLVATRLSKEDFPVKLYYNQNVYVRNKSLAG